MNGLWNASLALLKQFFVDLVTSVEKVGRALWWLLGGRGWEALGEWIGLNEKLAKSYDYVTEMLKNWWENTKKFYSDWLSSYAEDSDKIIEKTEQVNEALLRLAKFISEDPRFKAKPIEDIVRAVEHLSQEEVDRR